MEVLTKSSNETLLVLFEELKKEDPTYYFEFIDSIYEREKDRMHYLMKRDLFLASVNKAEMEVNPAVISYAAQHSEFEFDTLLPLYEKIILDLLKDGDLFEL